MSARAPRSGGSHGPEQGGDDQTRERARHPRFGEYIEYLRAADPVFAEASRLRADEDVCWQAAVYLVTSDEVLWSVVGREVLEQRGEHPLERELREPRRAWSSSQALLLSWAAHMWAPDTAIGLPHGIDMFTFRRLITALHLRYAVVPGSDIRGER